MRATCVKIQNAQTFSLVILFCFQVTLWLCINNMGHSHEAILTNITTY